MLAGFLTVLKIIGIVLLVILAVVLVFLLLVLFVPIRYRADALLPDTEMDEDLEIFDCFESFDIKRISASASFSWLWFVLRGGIEFPKNREFTVKVFGIQIIPKKEKDSGKEEDTGGKEEDTNGKVEETEETVESAEEGSAESPDTETENSSSAEGGDKGEDTSSQDSTEAGTEEAGEESGTEEAGKEDAEAHEEEAADTEDESEITWTDAFDEEEDDRSFLDVLWSIFDAIDNFLKTPISVFEKIRYTISRVCDKIDMIKATLENPIFQRAYELVKKKLIIVLKMILPDKCNIKLMIGTGDPALTAQVTGAFSALYPFLYNKVTFQPDFNRRAVMGEAHLKGHITLFTIIYSAAVCYFNKDVKKTIRRFKKIIGS